MTSARTPSLTPARRERHPDDASNPGSCLLIILRLNVINSGRFSVSFFRVFVSFLFTFSFFTNCFFFVCATEDTEERGGAGRQGVGNGKGEDSAAP